ncbi:MAG: cyclopropane-fatty-acyl-phospholipid synthase [Micavibrio sp.]|nr:MAG: cyclopropane-fatty-acyl-phospholipid synthase [Micavibrio sp.]
MAKTTLTPLQKLGKTLLSNMLTRFIQVGTLRLIDSNEEVTEFKGTENPVVTVRMTDPNLPLKLFRNPDLYAGESYMDGTMAFEDGSTLKDFLGLFSLNRRSMASYPLQQVLRKTWRILRGIQQHNPIGKAQKNVAHHYDLSAELYKLFLDEDMQYSCAYFEDGNETLEQAQEKKKRHLAAKLKLEDGQRILDIGCGWGGLALDLAKHANVEILGVTLSEEQHKIAVERAEAEGLSDRVKFELLDYRKVKGPFDRIISVGMFEHVGTTRYDEFFKHVYDLLNDDGIALLHSIGHMSPPSTTSPWIRKYIFPGGYSPAMSEVFSATERQRLWVSDVEVLRVHYADTLAEWNKRFQNNRDKISDLYDERFCRMWEFYLTTCEMTFRTGPQMVFQMQLARTRDAAGLTRDYIFETEQKLKALENKQKKAA